MLVQKFGVNKLEHDAYIVISQPNYDIPGYEIRRDNSRVKKTRLFITLCFFLLLSFLTWIRRILRRVLIVWLGMISRIRLQVKLTLVTLKYILILSKFGQEIPQSQTADNPMAPQGKTLCYLRMMILQKKMKRLWNWIIKMTP